MLDCALHRDLDDYDQIVEQRRQDALSEILSVPQKLDDLEILASRAVASWLLGQMLADRQELNFWDIAYWADSSGNCHGWLLVSITRPTWCVLAAGCA